MKILKWISIGLALLVVSYFLFTWWGNRNYFESGATGHYTVSIGDTFEFQLSENSSTGYRNCWINSNRCTRAELVGKDYTSSLLSNFGYIGSGGRVTFIFKGIKKGLTQSQ